MKTTSTTTSYYYTYTDHLGSILTLTDKNRDIVLRQNGVYPERSRGNAWGRERDPYFWKYSLDYNVGTQHGFEWLNRGFTGHEHLTKFQLINMNGRVYDPMVKRMLSVDNFVQDGTSTQGYNRYSYALNNPLKYTDPSGEEPLTLLGLAILAGFTYLQGVEANDWEWNPANWDSKNEAGEDIYYTAGVGGNANGVNSVSTGVSVGGPGQMVSANWENQATAASSVDINWDNIEHARGNGVNPKNLGSNSSGMQFEGIHYESQASELWREANTPITTIELSEFTVYGNRNTTQGSQSSLYLDKALSYEGVDYKWGGVSRNGIDCSGLVCASTGNGRVWTTSSGAPPGNWNQVYPNTSSNTAFINGSQRGDLYVWPGRHAAFYAGNKRLFHAHGSPSLHGIEYQPTGYTGVMWWLNNKKYPNVYRQK